MTEQEKKETRKEILRLAKILQNPKNDEGIRSTIIWMRGQLDVLEKGLKCIQQSGSLPGLLGRSDDVRDKEASYQGDNSKTVQEELL